MPILSPEELRKHLDYPQGPDADDALVQLLDAAEAAIVQVAGTSGAYTELLPGGWPTLILARQIGTLTTITESFDGTPLVLASDDYRHIAGGYVLNRLSTGTNPGYSWSGRVQVIYTPANDMALRIEAQVNLLRQMSTRHPGLSSQAIGDWAESYLSSSEYEEERDAILDRLSPGSLMVVPE
jgi:hypothetical protein